MKRAIVFVLMGPTLLETNSRWCDGCWHCCRKRREGDLNPISACYKAAAKLSGQVRAMSKQAMREEAERLIRETMEKRNLVIKQGNTRIEAVCGKCGAPNRLSAEKGATRVKYACKQCGHKQETL
jgi:DNA-directed RNA polymerase subunit RPC12/RpoP